MSAQSIDFLLQDYEWRNVGPANQGGRISDVEAYDDDFTQVYIAVASGGVWKSDNAGTTWTPIFDDYETASIGDLALDQNNKDIIWVGTGEANNRNSVSWGNGIYKSEDGGKTFQNLGLKSTHQIARVLVHPEESDDVCVCAIGHLWGYSGERGLFQTTDGGRSWNKLNNGLPTDGKTGCTDLVRDPNNPDILYAAYYHRLRQPWHFHSGGEEGGIYKSTDGGKSWNKLEVGLPAGPTGRIGLSIYKEDPNILMAIVEAEKTDTLSMAGSGIYRTENGGASWEYLNTYNNRPFYYSQIRINPSDDQSVYVLTTKFMVSDDGGKTFRNGSKDYEVHGDFHAMWVDPNDKDRYYLGADKGFSLTHDHGKSFRLIDNLPIAQYYRINYDMQHPYYIYGGLQDNGSYAVASFGRDARGILSDHNWKMHWGDGQDSAANPDDHTDMYSSMENGSYFKYNPETRHINHISPNAFNTTNFWDYFDKEEEDRFSALRFNWSAPLVMSQHNANEVYVGANHLYKTSDKGKTWTILSPDLSTNHERKRLQGLSGGVTPENTGAETHCSITGISISDFDAKMIWVGTDDGNIQLTLNEGKTWKNVRDNIEGVPEELWVSRIVASKFDQGRAYVSFDGHRSDHNRPYVFVTEDYGESWRKIVNGFPANEVIRVIIEDLKNPNLLFSGTETGVWISIDRGQNWARLKLNMPTVSVYDMKIHPRENDLIVGTHGRSAWVLEDISALQQLTPEVLQKPFHLYTPKAVTLWENKSRGGQRGHFVFAGDNPKNVTNSSSVPRAKFKVKVPIHYYVGSSKNNSLLLRIEQEDGRLYKEFRVDGSLGNHCVMWDREFETEELSKDDIEELDLVLGDLVKEIDNSRVRRYHKKLKSLKDSNKIRKLIEPLTGGYLSYDFDEKFLTPIAGSGTYKVILSDGETVERTEISLEKDPIVK